MPDLEPITRDEKLWSGEDLEPITRREMYIKHLYDETQVIPDKPITREEMFILKAGEELHDVTIEQLNVTENGTYSEAGKAYSPVIVNVPQTTLTTLDVTENGTYTAPSGTAYNKVDVDVPLPDNAYLLKDIPATPASIATFNDGAPLPMPKLEIAVEPQQEGSGDPSPTNIRPISGWTEGNVTRYGKNLIDVSKLAQQVVTSQGDLRPGVPVKLQVGTYTISAQSGSLPFYITRPANNYSYISINALPFTFSLDNEEEVIVRIAQPNMSNWDYVNLQLEKGNTATAYEPYNGSTITIQLGDTYYGGKLRIINGVAEFVATVAEVDLGTLDWQYSSISERFYVGASDLGVKATDASTPFNAISSALIAKSYNEIEAKTVDYAIGINPNATQLFARYSSITSASDFITAMNGVQLVYELATPTIIPLGSVAISSLLGVNNIFADCGNIIDGQYFGKGE